MPRHYFSKSQKHLTADNSSTLKSQITNADQTNMNNLLCSSASSCLNLHPTTQRHTLPHKSPDSFMELVNVSELPWAWFHNFKVCFSWFALFPNLDFELLMVWIFFGTLITWFVMGFLYFGILSGRQAVTTQQRQWNGWSSRSECGSMNWVLSSLSPFLLVFAGNIAPVDHRWN